MDISITRRTAAVALSVGLAAALTTPAAASASPTVEAAPSTGTTVRMLDLATPDMLLALQRDLGLSPTEAIDRLVKEEAAMTTERKLRAKLGDDFAGAWLNDTHQLVVAVTDPADAPTIRAAGALPELVPYSEATLDAAMSKLDRAPRPDADAVVGWHVDVMTNSVVIEASPSGVAEAEAFLAASGIDPALARIEETTERPQLFYDIRGGDAYYPGNSRCSVGFSVTRGFVTAGHCGGVGTTTRGYNGVAQGTVRGSIFPGNDMAWVETNANWTPRPWVNRYSGNIVVNGSAEAPINAAVCRSGSTTGYRCGTLTHKNRTVNYAQGSVRGLTRTTACAEPGDSGGSFIASGINAQGVTSGGSGNCTYGGVTYFQPVNPILSRYGLTLVRG